MSVYKEGWYAMHIIGSAQHQIWGDSADYGTPFKKGDRFWNLAKQAADSYAKEGSRRVEEYLTGKTATIDIELMNEGDGPGRGKTTTCRLEVVIPEKGIKVPRTGERFDGYMTVTEVN